MKKMLNKAQKMTNFAFEPINSFRKNLSFKRNMIYAYYYDLLKIDKKMILFESFHGNKIGGNPMAIFLELLEKKEYKGFKYVWVINKAENHHIKKFKKIKNVIFVKRESEEYLKYLAQAKYLINDTTFPFYFQKKKGQIYVNTWHGTPIKTLGKNVNGPIDQHKNAIRNFLHVDYLINPNKFTCDILTEAHELNGIYEGKVVDSGYPRVDLTIKSDKEKIKEELSNTMGIKLEEKIILYAPTWRGELGKVDDIKGETIDHIYEMYSKTPKGYTFLIKVHDLTYRFIKDDLELEKISVPDWYETNELLSVVDILITDYSSIFFDFLHTQKPIIFFVYDREKYEEKRGLYLDLDEMPGPLCYTVDETIESIKKQEENEHIYKEKYKEAVEKYAYNDDGKSTERLINIVFNNEENENAYEISSPEKKKILIYGGGFTTNGVTTSVINLLNNIDYDKYEVVVIYGGKLNPSIQTNLQKINPKAKIIYRMGSFNFRLIEYYKHRLLIKFGLEKPKVKNIICEKLYQKELKRLIGDVKFDIGIDFSGYSPLWSLLVAYNDFKVKGIYLHSDMVADSNRVINGKRKFKKNFDVIFPLYKVFDKLICVSKDATEVNKEKLEKYNVKHKIINVDNALDHNRVLDNLDDYEIRSFEDMDFLVNQSEIKNGTYSFEGVEIPQKENTNFVSLGRLSPEKDHFKLIKAFAKINKTFENTRLYIIGDGELKGKIIKLIDDLGLNGKVILAGEMDNPFVLMEKCDCFIMSSNYEGQGLVILEALMLQKSVISVDIPGPRGIIEDKFGLLVENSESGLIEGMMKYIIDFPECEKFDYKEYNRKAMELFYDTMCEYE